MKNLRTEILMLCLLLLTVLSSGRAAAAPDLGESLDYTLRFRGLVTGFVELDIARLTLSVESALKQMEGRPAYLTRMQLTTEPYKKAELIYPVRLDYRSWLETGTLQPLMATKSLVTGKEKWELFRFDRADDMGYHYQTGDGKTQPAGLAPPRRLLQMASLDDGWSALREHERIPLDQSQVVDYMAMLHQLRRLPAEIGKWFDFTVFNGKKLIYYRAHLDRDRLVRRGWDRDALLVKLYEHDPDSGKLDDEVQLWISDDDQRLLLRFYAESTAGALEGILETGRPDNGRHDPLPEPTRRSLERYLDF